MATKSDAVMTRSEFIGLSSCENYYWAANRIFLTANWRSLSVN